MDQNPRLNSYLCDSHFFRHVKEGKQDIFPENPQLLYYLDHQYITRFITARDGRSVAAQWPQHPQAGDGEHRV
jgi:hypothetical protein